MLLHLALGPAGQLTEGGPLNANLPACGVADWAFHLGCQQDPKRYLYDDACIDVRKKCRRTPNPVVCPDVSKAPAWWFMEPGWYVNPPDWAVADPHPPEQSAFVELAEEGQRRAATASAGSSHDGMAGATAALRDVAADGGGGGEGLDAQLRSQIATMRGLLAEQEAGIETVQRGVEQAERAFARLRARTAALAGPPTRGEAGAPNASAARGGARSLQLDGRQLLGTLLELQQLVQAVTHRYAAASREVELTSTI